MKTKEYISKYKLHLGTKFNHSEFVSDLTIDFMTLLEVGKARESFKGYSNAVNAIRQKFDAINNKTVGCIPDKLWNYFFATVIAPLREKLFPQTMERQRKEKEERQQRYKEYYDWERSAFGGWDDDIFNFLIGMMTVRKPTSSFEILGLPDTSKINDVKKGIQKISNDTSS